MMTSRKTATVVMQIVRSMMIRWALNSVSHRKDRIKVIPPPFLELSPDTSVNLHPDSRSEFTPASPQVYPFPLDRIGMICEPEMFDCFDYSSFCGAGMIRRPISRRRI
jgi:hypothetical protein